MSPSSEGGRATAVDIRGVRKTYGAGDAAVTALRDVSLEIGDNEFFTLLGPSGCGKTTLLRILAGFETPDGGTIRLHGRDIEAVPAHRRRVNTVFQSYALFPHMSVAGNIAFGLENLGRDQKAVDARVADMLRLVHMDGFGARTPEQLSGGQRQRVALARALAPEPEVLLLDEPLSALDLKLRQAMRDELRDLQRRTGITFLFVTHDQEEALDMSDRVCVLAEGEVQQVGPPQEIYENPVNRFVAGFVGDTNFLDVEVRAVEGGRATVLTPMGVTVSAPHRGAAPGRPATLSIRPERIGIGARATGVTVDGEVVGRNYLGGRTRCLVRTEGAELRAEAGEGEMPEVGQRLRVGFPEDAARVLGE